MAGTQRHRATHPREEHAAQKQVSAESVLLSVRMIFEVMISYRARKSRTTLQNKVRLKVLPEQLTRL